MEMDAYDDDIKVVPEARRTFEVDYKPLTHQDVKDLMAADIDYIRTIFGVDSDVAALLLRHMDWNRDRLTEKYMDNASSISTAAGVIPTLKPSNSAPDRSKRVTRSSKSSKKLEHTSFTETFLCPICFDDTAADTLALSCGHSFCTGCWTMYTISKIRDEGEHRILCMGESCGVVALDPFVHKVLSEDEDTAERYDELLVRNYVACNRNLKYCPFPSCDRSVSCPTASSRSALSTLVPTVSCGADPKHKFCFGCHVDGDHRPVLCTIARMWLKKCRDDSETANWIKSNTKECSKCQSTIEKNGGCNHMTCKKCKYEFCWVCMGSWAEHGTAWYSCNRYDDKSGVDARDAQSKSRASLERYLHYYNRWANHEQSAKLSIELYMKTEKKMEEMQLTTDLTWIEVQFMKKAVDIVENCRTTLKWTYAMAYYLETGNEKAMFEDNQRDLEKAVEDLSELLEQPIEADTIPALRQKVTDKSVYVQKRNEILLEDTAKGYLEERWIWNVTVDNC
jgi:ariadne-1